MKRPIKPSKPIAPPKPKEPSKHLPQLHKRIYINSGLSLQQLIQQLGTIAHNEAIFYVEADQYGDGDNFAYLDYPDPELRVNTFYDTEVKKYKKDLKKYEDKYKKYKEKLDEYEKQLMEYNEKEKEYMLITYNKQVITYNKQLEDLKTQIEKLRK